MLPKKVLTTLLLPGDSTGGRAASADRECYEEALWYAKKVGGEVRLLHVLDESVFPAEVTQEDIDRARTAAEARLSEYGQAVAADGVPVSLEVRAGFPWLETIRAARSWGADLIVAGSRRRASRFFVNALFGSTSRRVLRKSEIPVWIARDTGDPPITNIAVAVDLSLPMSARLLEMGEVLRQKLGARAHVVHSLPYELPYHSLEAISVERMVADERREREIDSAHEQIDALLGDAASHWTFHVGEGPVVADLGRLVEREGVDLVLMGSVSRAGIPGLVVGNTAEAVFARLDCPLWVFKPEGWVSPVPMDDGVDASPKLVR